MEKFKGTPGPWLANRFDVETDDSYVCSVADHHLDDRLTIDEAELISVSNANLIAAAPDLLEALQRLVSAAGEVRGEHVIGLMDLDNAVTMADVAIDRALGKNDGDK